MQELAGALVSVAQAAAHPGQGLEVRERLGRAVQSLQRIVQLPGAPATPEGTPIPPPELLRIPLDLALPAGYACARWLECKLATLTRQLVC